MELRKLKSFLLVAKELHFGKAAEKSHITLNFLTVKRITNRKGERTEALS